MATLPDQSLFFSFFFFAQFGGAKLSNVASQQDGCRFVRAVVVEVEQVRFSNGREVGGNVKKRFFSP